MLLLVKRLKGATVTVHAVEFTTVTVVMMFQMDADEEVREI